MKYFIHLPMKMEPIVSSETSAIRTQTPGNYPKRNKLHLLRVKEQFEYNRAPYFKVLEFLLLNSHTKLSLILTRCGTLCFHQPQAENKKYQLR